MDLTAARRSRLSRRHWGALTLAGVIALMLMALAAPAQAASNIGLAWGQNSSGQLGDGTSTGPEECGPFKSACSSSPTAVAELSGVKAVSAGNNHSVALLENGTVWSWGSNEVGQLGNGSTTGPEECGGEHKYGCSTKPVEASGLAGVVAVSAGPEKTLALLSNGTVMAWGAAGGFGGSLGDGNNSDSDVPVAVCAPAPEPCPGSHLSEVVAISAGSGFGMALLSSGKVMAWGSNSFGRLGIGTETSSVVPVEVTGLSEAATAIAAGEADGFALLKNGTVMGWGYNFNGDLGNGTANEGSKVPVPVSNLKGVKAIATAAEGQHTLALLTTGKVMAWGPNGQGQLGDGTSTGPEGCGTFMVACSKKPVEVSGLSGVTAVSAGGAHSMALLSSGTVMAWGRNAEGELGGGTSSGPEACEGGACSTKPVPVSIHGVALGISTGQLHSLAFGPPPPAPTNLPELGRCKAVAKGTGQYQGLNCQHLAGGKGNASWTPGAEKNKFEGSSSTTVLATPKLTISCATTILEGEYTGAKTATATLVLKGCTNTATKVKCQSKPGSEGEIESTMPLEGELGFIKGGEKPVVGVDFKKSSTAPNLASFFCATGPEKPELQGTVEGSLIGALKPAGKMAPEYTLAYKGSKGKQTPERFEGGLKDTLAITFTPTGPEPPVTENASLSATLLISNEEPLEIKAVTYPR